VTLPAQQAGTTKPLRVLVADDSSVQRTVLVSIFEAEAGITVAGVAANGAEAVRSAAALKPDVIVMDYNMPEMDGVQASQRIMQETPTPIVMVTETVAITTLINRASNSGVLAVVTKPLPGPSFEQDKRKLVQTIKTMAAVKLVRRWAPDRLKTANAALEPPAPQVHHRACEVVAIGASTGGPQALQEILTALPGEYALPVLVVQHIAADFMDSMVNWLRPMCSLPVELAQTGMTLGQPGIYFAPQGHHLGVKRRELVLLDDPPIRGHRPSATVLFEAVAAEYGAMAVGVLLTGMGDDGASGLREMKRAGALTVAQDEASSVVFGMPAAAIGMGVVDYVLPPSAIAPLLTSLARGQGGHKWDPA